MSFIFGGDTNFTYDQIQQKRKIADAMMQGPTPRNVGQGIESFTGDIAGALLGRRLDKRDSQLSGEADDIYNNAAGIFGGGAGMGANVSTMGGGGMSQYDAMAQNGGPTIAAAEAMQGGGDPFLSLIDRTEGGGNYSTLFGHSQRSGPFEGTDISEMSVGQAIDFANPSGPYGQWVKGKVGRVATPMGRYQIVGTTLRNAAEELGISPDTPFNAQTQDRIATHLAQRRLAGAGSQPEKREQLRNEWEGLRHVSDAQVDQAIAHLEGGTIGGASGGQPTVSAMNSQPQGMGNIRQIAEALGNPYIQRDPGKVAVLQAMMQQQMAAQQPMSRMDQIGLQRAELELAQMQNPQPDIPDSVQALELRAQMAGLAPGTPEYQSFMLSGGDSGPLVDMSGMSVGGQGEVGTIPPGYELYSDPATGARSMRLIEGSPQALEQQQEAESRDRQETLTGRQLNPTIDDIVTARDLAETGIGRTGMMSGIIGAIPGAGQGAVDLRETIDAIGAGISLENLNQMRQASPTGGALGNVSDKQSALLSSSFGSLNQSQSKPLFLYNLARVENTLNDIVHGEGNGPERHDMTALRRNLRGEDAAQVSEDTGRGQIVLPDATSPAVEEMATSPTPPAIFSESPMRQTVADGMGKSIEQLWSDMSPDQRKNALLALGAGQ